MDLRTKLLELLGAESAGGWLIFMDELKMQLPFLFQDSPGRPEKELIDESYIGKNGFNTWSQMVVDKDGLNWSYDTYKKWRSAYNLVCKHDYLRDLGLTYSQINTRNLTKDPAFPVSIEEWQEDVKRVKASQNDKKAKSLAAANNKNQKLSLDLEVANALLVEARLDNSRLNLNVGVRTSNGLKDRKEIDELKAKIQVLTTKNTELKSYQERIDAYNAKGSLAKLFSSP